MAENKRELTLDVSDAIKALKALQREAKEATRALREAECVLTTKELQAELERREGVKTYEVAPHGERATIHIDCGDHGEFIQVDGPAVITVNKD